MERAFRGIASTVALVGALAIVLLAVFLLSYAIGVCAGVVHLGYEWATS